MSDGGPSGAGGGRMTPSVVEDPVLGRLLAGNRRWARSTAALAPVPDPHEDPLAVLVCCAELGAQPERIFGLRPGVLLVLQGFAVCQGPSVTAGIAFAVEQHAVRLVMVMAHTGCRLVDPVGVGSTDRACHGRQAASAVRRLWSSPELAPLLIEHDVGVVPLVFDRASALVRVVELA